MVAMDFKLVFHRLFFDDQNKEQDCDEEYGYCRKYVLTRNEINGR